MPKICIHCQLLKEDTQFPIKRTPVNPNRRGTVCKECINKQQKIWRDTNTEAYQRSLYKSRHINRENYLAKRRSWDKANPEKKKAYDKRNYEKNREKRAEINRKWREKNREKIKERKREYSQSASGKEIIKAWWKTNAQKRRQYGHTNNRKHGVKNHEVHRARKRNLPFQFFQQEQNFCLQYWGYACAYCGNQRGFHWSIVFDHFIPIADSSCPGTVPWNMVPACHGKGSCNSLKNARNAVEWIQERFGQQKARQILKRIQAYFALVKACENHKVS